MKKYLFLIIVSFFLSFSNLGFSQTNVNIIKDTIHAYDLTDIDEFPSFVGGHTEMSKFISDNIVFPKSNYKTTTSGKVIIGFSVEKDGTLTNFKIVKGFYKDFNYEALRVVKLMPKWNPGKINDKPVKVKVVVIPINFE